MYEKNNNNNIIKTALNNKEPALTSYVEYGLQNFSHVWHIQLYDDDIKLGLVMY